MFHQELIGEEIEVIESTQPFEVGKKGQVVDETKETLVLQCAGKKITVFKRNITIKLKTGQLVGSTIQKRPEERIK